MPLAPTLVQESCLIPAVCFNRVRLLHRQRPGTLEFELPGLANNRMQISSREWTCWNDRLGAPLLSWHDFQISDRRSLAEPVPCTLSIHHSYSRTVIFHIYDSLEHYCTPPRAPGKSGQILSFPTL